jgi:streptogramin lyase
LSATVAQAPGRTYQAAVFEPSIPHWYAYRRPRFDEHPLTVLVTVTTCVWFDAGLA